MFSIGISFLKAFEVYGWFLDFSYPIDFMFLYANNIMYFARVQKNNLNSFMQLFRKYDAVSY